MAADQISGNEAELGGRREDQEAFFFVVPLGMEGRWRLLRGPETFDPDRSTMIDFDDGEAKITRFHQGDGGLNEICLTGPFHVQGGKLTMEFEEGEVHERIAGAAMADPDIVSVLRTRWYDCGDGPEEVERERFTLIREEVAHALRVAEAQWPGATLRRIH